jgi:hypothetical protein
LRRLSLLEEDHEQSQNVGLVPLGCVRSRSLLRVGEGGRGMCHGRWLPLHSPQPQSQVEICGAEIQLDGTLGEASGGG